MIIPQGRLLGGGAAINAMVYLRGQPQDYDAWAEVSGNPGWGPPPSRSGTPTGMEGNAELGGAYHGREGPLKVSYLGHMNPVTVALFGGQSMPKYRRSPWPAALQS